MGDPDWFEGNDERFRDGRTDDERRFIARLRARAQSWTELELAREQTQAWTDRDYLYVHVDVADETHNLAYGTLRVDYVGSHVRGHWGSADFCDEIDPSARDAFESPPLTSPEEAATYAADWLEAQLRRPAECREWWQGNVVVCREWTLTEPEHPLCRQYCHPSRMAGLPDVIVRVIPLRADRRT
jgi:hypothetical protein